MKINKINYNRYTLFQFSSLTNPRGEVEMVADRNNPMGQTFLKGILNNPMKTIIDERKPPVTLTQFCGQDEDSFRRYMVAKEAMLRLYSERAANKGSTTFTHEEITCLFDCVHPLREFYWGSLL